jgi:hypothetical protein
MWEQIARGWRFDIPSDEFDRITPVLDDLFAKVRPALDRDLSAIAPVSGFRPVHGGENIEI